MALIKFEIKKEHLILIKFLDWRIIDNNQIGSVIEEGAETPFGGIDLIEDIGIMIYGKPQIDFDPLSPAPVKYSEEQEEFIKNIWEELPIALEICCFLQKFEVGKYTRKWNLKNWKKI